MQTMQVPWLRVLALFVLIGAIGYSPSLLAQNTSKVRTGPMPDEKFYSLTFRHILFLHNNDVQKGIAEMQPEVKDAPADLDGYYQHRLNTTAREESIYLAEAQAWATDVAPLDSQAHNIVVSIRALTPGGRLAAGNQPPAPPQSLVDLQKQRDAITLKHVANLRKALGEGRFAQLDGAAHHAAHLTFQPASKGHSNPMSTTGGNQ